MMTVFICLVAAYIFIGVILTAWWERSARKLYGSKGSVSDLALSVAVWPAVLWWNVP